MKITLILAFGGIVVALFGCSHSGAGAGPAGWTKVSAGTWVHGAGSAQQRYTIASTTFNGSLQDLASQQTINVVLHERGARFVRSDPFPNCPGQAGVATFRSPKAIIEDGFALQSSEAITILYQRPAAVANPAPEVPAAMNATLCVPPA